MAIHAEPERTGADSLSREYRVDLFEEIRGQARVGVEEQEYVARRFRGSPVLLRAASGWGFEYRRTRRASMPAGLIAASAVDNDDLADAAVSQVLDYRGD